MKKASFVFDANRCTGCGACRLACTIENALAPDVSWRRVETFNPRRHPIAPVFHLSLACNHCADAACMRACPALAYRRDQSAGAVLLDSDTCIGCGYCAWACPYDAPVFDESNGVMTKCTWCVDRLRAGLKPACATHCPTGALDHAEVPARERVQVMEGLPVATLDPSLHVIPLLPGRMQPEMAGDVEGWVPGAAVPGSVFGVPGAGSEITLPSVVEPGTRHAEPGTRHSAPGTGSISLRGEWPLAVFTLAAATLVGVLAGTIPGAYDVHPWTFAIAAAVTMGFGAAHLGRPDRAWRAILNVRRSWLSREVAVLSVFFTLATGWLFLAPESRILGWAAVVTGFAGLFAADQLYGVLPSGPGHGHSASVLSTGILMTAIAAAEPELAAIVGLTRLAVYARQRWNEAWHGRPARVGLAVARAGLTLAGIGALFVPEFPGGRPTAFVLALGGDAIDRCQYYTELERETPRRQMDLALDRRLGGSGRLRAGGAEATPLPDVGRALRG